ncbi:hypothetical protein GIB67_005668 [Kingdonia uniflora]|uniref:Uncharacterized protein n=1 Tax=Kingdonia uniflora TaxID=39325 RepID=A0A7J7NII8_9MAGN|nr:hypothetical protein GIB67_005668 [Kingdonia uniflora]
MSPFSTTTISSSVTPTTFELVEIKGGSIFKPNPSQNTDSTSSHVRWPPHLSPQPCPPPTGKGISNATPQTKSHSGTTICGSNHPQLMPLPPPSYHGKLVAIPKEEREYEIGEAKYYLVLVATAVLW